MYQKNTNPDVYFEETNRLIKQHRKIVEWIIKTKGSQFKGKNGYRNFRMWLYNQHTEIHQDNKKHL
jgi:hypothetical protein